MKSIQAFEAIDGKIFTDQNEAIKHEATLQISKDLDNMVSKHKEINYTHEDVVEFILLNKQKIFNILYQICEE